jgi:glutathione S-transferase
VVLGIKDLPWASVEIPRVPPKPDLMPLTGGYRRTPVMQIGADVFCDSLCIIRELQRRFPEPTLYPGGGAGLPWALSQWTDGTLLNSIVAVVLGAQAESLPEEFAADRGRLYFGSDYDLHALGQDLPHILAQVRAQLAWIDERVAGGRAFMLGDAPGLPDALCYYLVWFLRGRYAGGPALLAEFPDLLAWEQRVRDIGHGRPEDMSAGKALEIAAGSMPQTGQGTDPRDPQGLAPGLDVRVTPDGDGGDPSVSGTIVQVSAQSIAIARNDARVGDIVVHFPRVGYRVEPDATRK